jgi:hypothetical protein
VTRKAAGLAGRTLNQCGLTLVEQNSIHAAVSGVQRINGDRSHAKAIRERCVPDTRNALGDRYVEQIDTPIESIVPNARNIGAHCDALQLVAVVESIGVNARDTAGSRNRGYTTVVLECKPEAYDPQPGDCARDGYGTTGTGVPRNQDQPIIRRVIPLGLDPGIHCQKN